MAHSIHSWLGPWCLLTLFAWPAGSQGQDKPPNGIKPGAAAASVQASKSGLAAALRASTRNDPANFVPSVETISEFLSGPHTGPAEDAVVGVEVINYGKDGASETHHCSGLLLRCDGFFALPPAITTLKMSGGVDAVRQSVRIMLHPGTERLQQAQAYIRHYIVDGIDMTVMKVQGVHSPAARPLLPDQLKPGDEVELVWTDWDAAAGRFSSIKSRKANLGQPNLTEDANKGSVARGLVPFTAMQEGVPGGAAVVGPDGMAIGMLSGASAHHDRFTSFSVLAQITNCVAAASTTDEEFARLQKLDKQNDEPVANGAVTDPPPANANGAPPADAAAKSKHPKNDMIDVPGGPVRLPKAFQEDQRDMCSEVIACVPAFKIDRYKVSNKEYYDFWMSIPEKERAKREVRAALYPVSWAGDWPPFPAEIDDVPVIGVSVNAAQAYARSKGKRLPTTYEWTLAVFGPFGDAVLPAWVNEYSRQRQQAWNRIVVAHEQYLSQQIMPRVREEAAARDFEETVRKLERRPQLPQRLPIATPISIPFFTADDQLSEASQWSVRLLQDEVKQLCEQWINPLYLLPAGSRPYDTTPYGMMDALLNGNERVVHSPEPFRGADPPMGGRPTAAGLGFAISNGLIFPTKDHPMTPLTVPRSLTSGFQDETSASAYLLSRRLLSSSSQVRPLLREFAPSDSEKYSEYRARIYEDMMMALPLESARMASVRFDTMTTDSWGEMTIIVKTVPREMVRSSQLPSPEAPTLFGLDGLAKRLTGELRDISANNRGPNSRPQYDEAIPYSGNPRTPAYYGGMYYDETWFYPLLAGLSPYMTREMGRDWAKDPPVHVGPWPEINASLTQPPDVFLVANGFRCAR